MISYDSNYSVKPCVGYFLLINWSTNYWYTIIDMSEEILKNFKEIVIEKPVDKIINQIKELISSGQLKSGDRLPSERMLCDRFGVGRTAVREALQKLEFYGILKTMPQSGTIVAGLGETALVGLINNVLELHQEDFRSLMEARFVLEIESARLAAKRATSQDVAAMEEAHRLFAEKVQIDDAGIEEDHMFHLRIAEASKNSILKSLLLFTVSDMISFAHEYDICRDKRYKDALKEHQTILDYIKQGKADQAGEAMRNHLKSNFDYIPNTEVNGKTKHK